MVVALISFRTRDYLSSPALLPHDFHNNNNNNNIILEALSFIMNNKITEFEDRFIKQLCGTTMGTSVAVMYTGLYYGWHEKIRLLPGYSEEIQDLHDSSTIYLSYGSAALGAFTTSSKTSTTLGSSVGRLKNLLTKESS